MKVVSRTPLRLAYLFLLAWAASWPLLRATGASWLAEPQTLHFSLLGLGFGGQLVLGITHGLLLHFHGRPAPRPAWLQGEAALLAAPAVLLFAAGGPVGPVWRDRLLGSAAWALAAWAVLFSFVVLRQIRSRAGAAGCAAAVRPLPGDRMALALAVAAAAAPPAVGLLAVAQGLLAPATVHAWTLGFLLLPILAVLHRLLPRFAAARWPRWLPLLQGGAALAGVPLFVAGLALPWRPGMFIGSAVLLLAVLLFGAMAVAAAARRHSRSPVTLLIAAAALFLVAGAIVGSAMTHTRSVAAPLAFHPVVNLVGFVGITALAMGSVFLGVAIRRDPRDPLRSLRRLGTALVLAVAAWGAWAAVLGLPPAWLDLAVASAVAGHGIRGIAATRMPRGLPLSGSSGSGPCAQA